MIAPIHNMLALINPALFLLCDRRDIFLTSSIWLAAPTSFAIVTDSLTGSERRQRIPAARHVRVELVLSRV